jgi:23S rRNA (cytidine1920-2'-O)/16S rRNA (cytidine1409-2'-O)-methyltransferase
MTFVSRGGLKLQHALSVFGLSVDNAICADLGCSTGGFTDCLLQHGAAKVYAVDTGYGVLDYTLRKNPRVVVMERVNALHVELPEKVSLITIDVNWTRQHKILPVAKKLLCSASSARIITLIKPHYEAEKTVLHKGVVPDADVASVVQATLQHIAECGFDVVSITQSPIRGSMGKGNTEFLALLQIQPQANADHGSVGILPTLIH